MNTVPLPKERVEPKISLAQTETSYPSWKYFPGMVPFLTVGDPPRAVRAGT